MTILERLSRFVYCRKYSGRLDVVYEQRDCAMQRGMEVMGLQYAAGLVICQEAGCMYHRINKPSNHNKNNQVVMD